MAGLTPKQEAFCHAYIETSNASEAYRRAYPKSRAWKPETLFPRASKLLKNYNVVTRLAELTAKAAEKHEVTVETIAAQLDEDRDGARGADQFSAAISATLGKAKLYGLLVEKRENVSDLEALDDTQLAERVRQLETLLAEDTAPKSGPARAGRDTNGTEAPTRH